MFNIECEEIVIQTWEAETVNRLTLSVYATDSTRHLIGHTGHLAASRRTNLAQEMNLLKTLKHHLELQPRDWIKSGTMGTDFINSYVL